MQLLSRSYASTPSGTSQKPPTYPSRTLPTPPSPQSRSTPASSAHVCGHASPPCAFDAQVLLQRPRIHRHRSTKRHRAQRRPRPKAVHSHHRSEREYPHRPSRPPTPNLLPHPIRPTRHPHFPPHTRSLTSTSSTDITTPYTTSDPFALSRRLKHLNRHRGR